VLARAWLVGGMVRGGTTPLLESPKGCNGNYGGGGLLSRTLESLVGPGELSGLGDDRKKACWHKRLSPAKSPCG
jgi:hypothetical protein